ncbi:MAG: metallophosphoesterase [Bacteroidota bacterium]
MKIILITDLHIGTAGEDTYGIDVRQNFLTIKSAIQEAAPDHIVIAGDLCYSDGVASTYDWIKDEIDALSIPYDVIVGNHDDASMLATAFDLEQHLKEGAIYYKKALGDWTAFFLDTRTKTLSEVQLQWLQQQLEATPGKVLLFMHHPPILMEVPFMDKNHSLLNRGAVQNILLADGRPIPVFSGHYHVEKTAAKHNISVQITPSCFFQIAQQKETFELDHRRIAYREITLREDTWRSTVRYFDGTLLVDNHQEK